VRRRRRHPSKVKVPIKKYTQGREANPRMMGFQT